MKSWKKQLGDELDALVPELREDVRNAPVARAQSASDLAEGKRRRALSPRTKKTLFASLATAAAAFLILFAVIASLPAALPALASSCVTVKINPEANFVTDKKGNVTHVTALNEDADLLFSDEEFFRSLTGKPLDEAVSLFVDRAAQAGYFDFNEAGGAVKLTASDAQTTKCLSSLSASLEDFFRERGAYAVVAAESVPDAQFRLSLGIPEDGSLLSQAEKVLSSFTQRIALTMTDEERSSYYRETVLLDEFRAYLQSLIREHFRDLRECAALIDKMTELNARIEEHPDNPNFLFLKDYWNVLLLADEDEFTADFLALTQEMTALLARYRAVGGSALSSKSELELRASYYEILPIDELEKLATDFTEADFDLFAEDVLDLLDSVGVDTALLRRLMQLPSDLETFFRQTMEALTECARLRFEIFREAYEQSREAISERDYREYLDRIEREFGSLNAYWDSLSQ